MTEINKKKIYIYIKLIPNYCFTFFTFMLIKSQIILEKLLIIREKKPENNTVLMWVWNVLKSLLSFKGSLPVLNKYIKFYYKFKILQNEYKLLLLLFPKLLSLTTFTYHILRNIQNSAQPKYKILLTLQNFSLKLFTNEIWRNMHSNFTSRVGISFLNKLGSIN